MINMIVWIKPFGDRPNAQRAQIAAIAVDHMMVTFCCDGKVECAPLNYLTGIEIDHNQVQKCSIN